jgi:hypothetical protein
VRVFSDDLGGDQVQPIAFEPGLIQFAQNMTDGQSKIVAIGSSTTAGEGNIVPYPGRLLLRPVAADTAHQFFAIGFSGSVRYLS